MNKSGNISHYESRFISPLSIKTSLVKSQNIAAKEFVTLLLQGIAMSTCLKGASVLHNAIIGIFIYELSLIA